MSERSPLVQVALLAVAVGVTAACGNNDTPTSPTTTTSTTTSALAEAKVFESFTGTLPVGGFRFFSFDVPENGSVTITLDRVGGGSVPTTVWVGLGVGVPDGTDCPTTTSLNTQSGGGPHISTTLTPGTYCARVYDIGNLGAAAPFAVTIGHP
jgi:Bacterial pre-peptidase C-terminal domain